MRSGGADLASYARRIGATFVDGLLIGLTAAVVVLVALGADASTADTRAVVLGVTLLSSLVYAPTLLCRTGARNGQTLGKQALSIRVVREDARPVTAALALQREFLGKGLLGLIPLYAVVDAAFALGGARRQTLHDKLASTFVLRADAVPDATAETDPFGRGALEAETR